MNESLNKILVTGASGYVGGRLVRSLEQRGYPVRCMARRPEYLRERVGEGTQVVYGDVFDPSSLQQALTGVDTAYYLIHALASENFRVHEREAAANFARAAHQAGVRRIIYLGGLGHGEDLSPHLASRQEAGEVLRNSSVPTLEFRAGIIIGSGSLSFEMIRALVRKLPIMITPRWTGTMTQPIGIEDVIEYLVQAYQRPWETSRIVEIGGSERVSYRDLMNEYSRQRNLKRYMLPVPWLSPWLSSLWLSLVTPVYAGIGRHLVEGLRNETIVTNLSARDLFDLDPMSHRTAIAHALANEDQDVAATRWSDALSSIGDRSAFGGIRFRNRIVDSRAEIVSVSPRQAFAPIQRIGGQTGWYCADLLWYIRGAMDRVLGGVGLRRGRRDPVDLHAGEALDFWRVEEFNPDQKLRLFAEMKLPGRAWLQFEVEKVSDSETRIRQTAIFDPAGLAGLVYWYALYPAHALVFRCMLRGIARAATIK